MRQTVDFLTGAVVQTLCPVCDYWQLMTDGPIVSIYNPFQLFLPQQEHPVCHWDSSMVEGQTVVGECCEEDVFYQITLGNGVRLQISLRPEGYTGPEGIYILNSNAGLFLVF